MRVTVRLGARVVCRHFIPVTSYFTFKSSYACSGFKPNTDGRRDPGTGNGYVIAVNRKGVFQGFVGVVVVTRSKLHFAVV